MERLLWGLRTDQDLDVNKAINTLNTIPNDDDETRANARVSCFSALIPRPVGGTIRRGGYAMSIWFLPGRHGTPTGFRARWFSERVGSRPLFLDRKSPLIGWPMT